MKLLKWLVGTASGLMLISCVTINIYFPAAAAEKAADKIIEDVWGPETRPKEEQPSQSEPSSSLKDHGAPIAMTILNWMVPTAEAAQANININSPAINAIQSQMKKRHNALKPYYASGAVGLTGDGMVTIRDAKAVPLKDRNKVKGLVSSENKDRQALYSEIARANGHPEWKADIQATFARRWVGKAAKGWWYQANGGWKQK